MSVSSRLRDGARGGTETTIDGQVTVTSGWKRESITVSEQCPRTSIDFLVDREHISTGDEDIRNVILDRIHAQISRWESHEWTPERETEALDYAVWKHRENQAVYRHVMGGMLDVQS